MVECRRRARLALEPLQQALVTRHRRRQKLQRDMPAEVRVLGLINHAHAPHPQLREDAVMRDGTTDHSRSCQTRLRGVDDWTGHTSEVAATVSNIRGWMERRR